MKAAMSRTALLGPGAFRSRTISCERSPATSAISVNRLATVGFDVRGMMRPYTSHYAARLSGRRPSGWKTPTPQVILPVPPHPDVVVSDPMTRPYYPEYAAVFLLLSVLTVVVGLLVTWAEL